jgi:hypothetical protein
MRVDARRVTVLSGVLLVALGAGCEKDADTSGLLAQDPAATAVAATPSAPSSSSRASVAERLSAPSHPAPSGSVAPDAPAPAPLAAWMRGPAADALRSGNLEAIGTSFDQMARWTPPGYPNWRSISVDGSRAARAGTLDAVKAACRECHAQYEARYHAELQARPLP